MKKLILIIITSMNIILLFAQITLEEEYAEGGTSNNNLSIVNLSNSGYKYQMIDKTDNEIKLYNLNHTIFKTISIPTQTATVWELYFISEDLFNTDSSDIEYLIQGLSPNHYVKIYDETGLNIITIENANLGGFGFFGYNPIIDTDNGTKMILNSNLYGWSRVYSLPGKLHQDYTSIVNKIKNDGLILSNPYPNPSLELTRIDYKLPLGINQAEIVFF